MATVVTIISILLPCQVCRGVDAVFRAGAAVADITPQVWPLPMVGTFSGRKATHAWDPLQARALVLDDSQTKIALVIVDSCYCPRSLFDEAKRRAARVTGIRADHMLMAATHTHTAPPARDRREVKADEAYVEHVIRGIVSAVQQAAANLAPAEMGNGVVLVPEEVFNRRWFMKPGAIPPNPFGETTDQVRFNPPRGSELLDRPAGPIDPEVCFLSVRTPAGRPIALLVNYSLHYVGGIPPGGVSADYFGEFARQIEQRLFPDGKRDSLPPFVGILSNGTSGNINNISFRHPRPRAQPLERIQAVASRVADRVFESLQDLEYQSFVPLAMAQSELTLNVRRPTDFQREQAKLFLAPEATQLPHAWSKQYARWAVYLAEHPGTESLILQAVRIGNLGITSVPCEVFVEIGLRIKEESPLKPTFTVELANGHHGYLPTPEHHRLGGYETWLGSCTLEIQASEKIHKRLLEMLGTLQ